VEAKRGKKRRWGGFLILEDRRASLCASQFLATHSPTHWHPTGIFGYDTGTVLEKNIIRGGWPIMKNRFAKHTGMKMLGAIATAAFGLLALASFESGQDLQDDQYPPFQLSSTTFENNTTLPISMIYNYLVSGSNVCSIDGSPGGDQSPELTWRKAPRRTASFVVIAFDTVAGFTHWGMYNIPATTTKLPENAGIAGSTYGQQVVNGFGDLSYDGPCPPAGVVPYVHDYVFTVYALDMKLELPSSANFPATADTLFRALVEAGRWGHILASASITGLYSTTPE
jgi:hypothetical protein